MPDDHANDEGSSNTPEAHIPIMQEGLHTDCETSGLQIATPENDLAFSSEDTTGNNRRLISQSNESSYPLEPHTQDYSYSESVTPASSNHSCWCYEETDDANCLPLGEGSRNKGAN